ncbi:MAG TPA: AAA family ATPase [Thermoanaerobaculia bacterium]
MKPVIRSLTLKGFRSFISERIDFGRLTFLVGQNGVGKSNLVDALALLQTASTHPLGQAIEKRGGLDAITYRSKSKGKANGFGLKVELGGPGISAAHYSFEVRPHGEHDFEVTNEQCHILSKGGEFWFHRDRKSFTSNVDVQPALDPQFLAFPVVGGTKQFLPIHRILTRMTVYKMDVEPLRRSRKAGAQDRLASDWSNAANVLQDLAEKSPYAVERIGEFLSSLAPANLRVQPRVQAGMVSLEFAQDRSDGSHVKFNAANISDGTLRILGLALAVFQRSNHTLMVFEEPEEKVYPGALSLVSDLLDGISRKIQVLATTHSPDLLEAKWIADENIRIVYWEDDASRVSHIGKASREALKERLMSAGELLRSSVLDRPPLHRERPDYSLFGSLP